MKKNLQPVIASSSHPNEMEVDRLKLVKRQSRLGYLRYDAYEKGKNDMLGTCTVVMYRGVGDKKIPLLDCFVSMNSHFKEYIDAANEKGIPIMV